MKLYTALDVLAALQKQIASAGGRKAFCTANGFPESNLSEVLSGKRPPPPSLLDPIGFERVSAEPRYRRKAAP